MDIIEQFLNKISYKFEKGYPDLDNPKDKALLESILNGMEINLKEEDEEKIEFDKQELIDFIKNLDDEESLKKIFKFAKSSGFYKDLEKYLISKNLTKKDITYFTSILQDIDKLGEFTALSKNPPNLDLTKNNFYSQIKGFTPNELEILFKEMKDSIKGTVSLGPGENFLSLFFGNVSKQGKKGDLNIEGAGEVELKSRVGSTGAIMSPSKYKRGDFTKSIKPYISQLISRLNPTPEQKKELDNINTPGGVSWPVKLDLLYKEYLKSGGDESDFIKSLDQFFKEIYPTLNFPLSDYIQNEEFDYKKFTISLARQLAKQYYEEENFDGLMFADYKGNFEYWDKDSFLNDIGPKIKISYPSDLLPRLKI